jgi:hypothetical protein
MSDNPTTEQLIHGYVGAAAIHDVEREGGR